ncbi:hypothetical protein [Streptococcus suis]
MIFFFFQAEDGIRDFCLSRGLEGEIEAQGNIDLDYPCIIPIDASFEAVDLLDGYTLFLETDYETVAYFINKRDITIK